MNGIRLCYDSIDLLMPMHLVFDQAGRILHAGPAIAAMAGPLMGKRLGDALTVRRPQITTGIDDLLGQAGRRLIVELGLPPADGTDAPRPPQRLRAVAVPLARGGGMLHFGFGPDLPRAVGDHGLSASDFSPIDPVHEILFLLEAQGLIQGELRGLTDRLDCALQIAEAEAETDRLTGLGNRRALDRHLTRLLGRGTGPGFGVMHLDLDHFKAVNDTLGHAAGDAVLEEVAAILREETRRGDMVCRMGGDEFVLIFPDCGRGELLAAIAERILTRLAIPIPFQGSTCRISGSIGIALSAEYAAPDVDRLLEDADAALYRSKHAGRAAYAFHGQADPPQSVGEAAPSEGPERRMAAAE